MFRKISNSIIALVLIAALGVLALVGIPLLKGEKLYAVLTESMVPTFPVGSIVVVEMVSPEEIQPNDVITFVMPSFDHVVTHRVLSIDAENQVFHTKGDNNEVSDPFPVPFDNLEGRVNSSYPYLGTAVAGMRTTGGIILILWVVAVFLTLVFLPDYLEKRKKEKNGIEPDGQEAPQTTAKISRKARKQEQMRLERKRMFEQRPDPPQQEQGRTPAPKKYVYTKASATKP